MNLNIQIEQKDKLPKFSLSKYEFVVLLNSSKYSNLIGRVYATPNNPFDRIYYKLLTTNKNSNLTNFININSLTGQLNFFNENYFFKNKFNDEIQFDVQASTLLSKDNSSKLLISKTNVKIYFRYFNYLNNISFEFKINSFKKNQISKLNNSNSFLIDKNIQINQELFQIFINSFYYPFDKYILSLDNFLNTFSLSSSSSLVNSYILKTRQNLTSTSIYMLNIGVKHKLSQQWLPNLRIELIVIDQSTTTTPSRIITKKKMITTMTTVMTSTHIRLMNESSEFCIENKTYIVYEINKKKNNKQRNEIGLLKVIKSNSNLNNNNNNNENLFISVNESEIIVNGCRMFINKLNNKFLNKSFEYELCSSYQCYNLTTIKYENENKVKTLFLSIKSIELIMLIFSIIFILITILLILLICRIKEINICLKFKKKNLFYSNNFHLNNVQQHLSSSTSKIKVCFSLFNSFIYLIYYFRKEFIQLLFVILVHHHFNQFE